MVEELGIVVVVFVFGIAPEVEAVGDNGVVLGLSELADDVDEEGNAALAVVLALGALTTDLVIDLKGSSCLSRS